MQDYLISRFNSFSLDTQGLTAENLWERSKKDFQYIKGSDTLIICLPGWNQELWTWGRVKRYVVNSNASFLAYEFPSPILSDQHQLTKSCFEVINQTVRGDIRKFKEQYGFKKCVLVTVSLASSFGSMIYKDNADITDVILIVPGENLARDMWHGCRTQHLRKSYEKQGITQDQLGTYWYNLASEFNMPRSGANVALYYGKEDQVIPYKYSETLVRVLEGAGFDPKVKILGTGHYLLIFEFLLYPQHFIGLTPKARGV